MSAFRTHGRGHLDGPVVVLGTGLLGASIGLGLRGRGVPVFLFDTSPTNQAVAVDIGAGRPLDELDAQPQLVVVAAPPDVTADVVEKALADYPEAVVVDIASVKAGIQADLRSRGVDMSRYVGTHPMAGREKSGPVAARGELFTSMPWVICPSEETADEARQAARSLAGDLGAFVSQFSADLGEELRDLARPVIDQDGQPGICLRRAAVLPRNPGLPRVAFADQLGKVKPGTRGERILQGADQPVEVLADAVENVHDLLRISTEDLDPKGGIACCDTRGVPQAVTGKGQRMERRPLEPAGQQ